MPGVKKINRLDSSENIFLSLLNKTSGSSIQPMLRHTRLPIVPRSIAFSMLTPVKIEEITVATKIENVIPRRIDSPSKNNIGATNKIEDNRNIGI
jgi:hypothetical protein